MFQELVESSTSASRTKKPWTVALSAAVQSACLLVLILVPLIYTQALPKAFLGSLLVIPAPQPAAPPAQQPAQPIRRTRVVPIDRFEPTHIAPTIDMSRDLTPPPAEQPQDEAELLGPDIDLISNVANGPAAPRPEPPPAPVVSRVQRGGKVQEAMLVCQNKPPYPALAQQIRLQGDVVLHAIIDKEGRVAELQVVSGHPLLVGSALSAVKSWCYRPTLLNSEPVEVETTITVSFVLAH
jgi:protein TonB